MGEADFMSEEAQRMGMPEPNEEPEPNFDDPEDFVDDISDDELLADILKNKPTSDVGLKSCVIVDGIPVVNTERLPKLRNVVMKIFSKCGTILKDEFPMDGDNAKGFAFIEFESSKEAQEAAKTYNGYRLDKHHVLSVNVFNEVDKYFNLSESAAEVGLQEYDDRGNLKNWLEEENCCDQFSIVFEGGEQTAIWKNSIPEPQEVISKVAWTEQSIHWSPMGTYMASFHQQGIILWGGPEFKRIHRFSHESVGFIDFSPCERYLITFSKSLMLTQQENAIIVWDIRTQAIKRTFFVENTQNIMWPIFKWSHDDAYFARIQNDALFIYETETFVLLQKKSLKIPGIRNFSWSPTQNQLAYWVEESQNVPARVTIIEVPSMQEVRAKNLFSVADCNIVWQKNGDYLCVKVERYSKKKSDKNDAAKYSGLYYNFEIFHIREKQVPVESFEIKENVVAFAFEPNGNKLAVISGEAPMQTVSFYGLKPGTKSFILLKKFESKPANNLFWSPTGQYIVLASLRCSNYTLEFVDTSDFSVTNTQEHFKVTDVEWDPTGRYVASSVSYWQSKSENCYWLMSFQGRVIRKTTVNRLCQFLWRPRPPTLLTEEKIKEIKKNLKKYAIEFDAQDRLANSKLSQEGIEKRQKQVSYYRDVVNRNQAMYEEGRDRRLALRGLTKETEAAATIEVEFELLVKEEILDI